MSLNASKTTPIRASEYAGSRFLPIRLRVVFLIAALQALFIGWVSDSEITRSVYLVCYSLMMPTVLYLFAARLFVRFLPFTRRELLFCYVVLTATLPIVGFGGLRFLLPGLGYLAAFAHTQPGWAADFARLHFGPLVVRDPAAAALLFGGKAPVPWRAWAAPLLFWGAYLLLLAGSWLGLAAVLRRSWIEEERLTFPIAALPLQVLDPSDGLFRRRLFWLGFAVPVVLQSLLQCHELVPTVPAIQLKATDYAPTLAASPPWNAIPSLQIGFYPTAVGLAYLVPTDISFGCWFFWLAAKLSYVWGAGLGLSGGAGGASRFPFAEEQAAGAWIGFAGMTLWGTRARLRAVRASLPSAEMAGIVRGAWGAGGCLLGAAGLMALAGVTVPAAAGCTLIYAAYVVTGARVRAEAGGVWIFAPFHWTPPFVMNQLLGTRGMPDESLVAETHFNLVQADVRAQSLPFIMEGLKIGSEAAIPWRTVLFGIGLGTVSALVIGIGSSLSTLYADGVATAKSNPLMMWKVQSLFGEMDGAVRNHIGWNRSGVAAMAGAAAFTLLLAWLRTRLPFFPFHPIGYVLCSTLTMDHFFAPFLLAWAIKTLVLRYGSLALYRRSLAGFLGLIFGDIVVQAVWTLLGRAFSFSIYQFLS